VALSFILIPRHIMRPFFHKVMEERQHRFDRAICALDTAPLVPQRKLGKIKRSLDQRAAQVVLARGSKSVIGRVDAMSFEHVQERLL